MWSLTLPLLFGDQSLSTLFLRGDLSQSLRLLGLRSRFFSSLPFSFCAEELPRLDIRASLSLVYFSTWRAPWPCLLEGSSRWRILGL